jgi:ATP-dependent protease ClpP protease subunit
MREVISKIPNVTVICKYCASAAGYLLATAPHRIVFKKSNILMHEMYIPHYTAKMVSRPNVAADLVRQSDEFNKAIYSVIGMTKEQYEAKIIDKEWTLEGEDIVKWHLADKFVVIHCDEYLKTLAPDTCSQ